MGRWSGTWENPLNEFGAMSLSPWTEFKKRVGRANIWQDLYMYDWPCHDYSTEGPCLPDWRISNISLSADNNYAQASLLDPYFGVSLQCGEIHRGTIAEERNIADYELLYNANLALIYGAKFLSLYTYFAQSRTNECYSSGVTCHAIVDILPNNSLDYTDKYYMLRYKLNPRLKGLFGKTLKKLNPLEQFAGYNGINYDGTPPENPLNGFLYIEDVYPQTTPINGEYGIEMGFFQDIDDTYKKYFMVLNRYYSDIDIYYIKLKELYDFKNWKITSYTDTTNFTTQAIENKVTFLDTLYAGDANLYSVLPVVKYGGLLTYADTIKTGSAVLTDNMTIQNGVNLIINTSYTAQDTVTLQGTGFITGDGYFYLQNNAKVLLSSWDRSLFKSKNGNHPKATWGKHPGGNPTYYKVYKRINQGSWNYLTQVNSPNLEFTDSSFNVNSTSGALVQADYKVTAFLNGAETSYSNIVTYRTPNYFFVSSAIINGWQTLSVPVIVLDFRESIVWPTSDPNSYTYYYWCDSYYPEDTLKSGWGYYIKFNSPQNISYVGGKLTEYNIDVCAQWNIVGSISEKVPFSSNVCLYPAENSFTALKYIYQNGYVQVDSVIPGMGHWVKVAMNGSIEVNQNPIICDEGEFIAEEEFDHFIITDSLGKQQDLYVANLNTNPLLEDIDLSMPPPLPEVEFDARFNEGEYIKAVSPDSGVVEIAINIETEAYPVTVEWELNPENGIEYSVITQGLGKQSLNRSSSNTTTITNGKFRMSAHAEKIIKLPTEYMLGQNYPNPFNPSTVIKYSLPKASDVRLSVYDILGREIKVLVDEKKEPGYYNVNFDAGNLASGVYIYKLSTKDFTKSQKMILIK